MSLMDESTWSFVLELRFILIGLLWGYLKERSTQRGA